MTATPSGFDSHANLINSPTGAAHAVKQSAIHSRVWLRIRRIADSAVKRRMSTEMADLAGQIRKIEYGDRI